MGFFARLRSVFAKKKEEKQDVTATDIKDTPSQSNEFDQAAQQEAKQETKHTSAEPAKNVSVFDPNTTGPNRDSKVCPKCGAPNDEDIHKCWLCKSEI